MRDDDDGPCKDPQWGMDCFSVVLEKPQVQHSVYHAARGPDGGDQNQTMYASEIIDLDECENNAV